MFRTLDKQQEAAVTHGVGPCLVLAGPGSGKTTVIVQRVCYLIAEQNVPPDRILVITYTRAAAAEMQQRFLEISAFSDPGRNASRVRFLTFHAFCYHLLRAEGQMVQLLSDRRKRELFAQLSSGLPPESRIPAECFFSELTREKSMDPAAESYMPSQTEPGTYRLLCGRWMQALRTSGEMDYDDLLLEAWRYLHRNPARLSVWQEKISHLLIDEAQDMNPLQLALAALLSGCGDHLFLVGDDDQSIYGFRGSDSGILASFPLRWPGGRILRLERNYRCGQTIAAAADRLIRHNAQRYPKQPAAAGTAPGRIRVHSYADSTQEAEEILCYLRHLRPEGAAKTAVLYRVRSQARLLLSLCAREGIPFLCRETVRLPAEHWLIRDLLAYLSLAAGCGSFEDLLRILNRPLRYLSRSRVPAGRFSPEKWQECLADDLRQKRAAAELEMQLQRMSVMTPFAALQYVWQTVGYGNWAESCAAENRTVQNGDPQDAWEWIRTLADGDYAAGSAGLRAFLRDVGAVRERAENALVSSAPDARTGNAKPGVCFSTFHGAKGMEFDTVILLDANEGVCPYGREQTPEGIEEERRLFYVAVTRARRRLHIGVTASRRGRKLPPSRFLEEMGLRP